MTDAHRLRRAGELGYSAAAVPVEGPHLRAIDTALESVSGDPLGLQRRGSDQHDGEAG
jgi:hypothetical protein